MGECIVKLLKVMLFIIILAALPCACKKDKSPAEDNKAQEQDQNQVSEDNNAAADNNNGMPADNDIDNNNQNTVDVEINNSGMEDGGNDEYTEDALIPPDEAERLIENISDDVIEALRDKDMETLASYVHPEKGVRFTLYSYVDKDKDLVFDRKAIKNLLEDQSIYTWGYYDGTGDPVNMTPKEYYDRFVYDRDFASADEIGYNTALSTGNTLNNQVEVYENPIIVEYYFPGFDPQYEGMDWESLSLIFEEYEGTWYLVGLVSSRWTG
jgi:hypothetical protein